MVNLWSKYVPGLQLVWDATSLRMLLECPQKYKLGLVDSWRSSGTDVEYGGLFASALEEGWRARAAGATFEEAQFVSVKWVLLNSGSYDYQGCETGARDWHPWGGSYVSVWRCKGEEKFKNEKGNAAKCPYSHKGKWFDTSVPETCGKCGSRTESARRWFPNDPVKNRNTLILAVSWYWEEIIERQANGNTLDIVPTSELNGQVPIEIPFVIPSGYNTSQGEALLLCGRLDSIKRWGGTNETFLADNKTTKNALYDAYFSGYSPDVQVDLYALAGSIILPQLDIKGVLIEAAQTGSTFARFGVRPFYRTEREREAFHEELGYWLAQAEGFAVNGYWPRNRASCRMCQFRKLCLKDEDTKQVLLEKNFRKEAWNPLREIGHSEAENGVRMEQQSTGSEGVDPGPGTVAE